VSLQRFESLDVISFYSPWHGRWLQRGSARIFLLMATLISFAKYSFSSDYVKKTTNFLFLLLPETSAEEIPEPVFLKQMRHTLPQFFYEFGYKQLQTLAYYL
jgi:hypothetical protein